ncbi:MAG: hypothetical protein K1V84_03380 [Muribaculaceae bacterium]
MHYRNAYFAFIAILMMALSSCSSHDDRLSPYRWKRLGEPFDSLTLELERKYSFFVPADSIAGDVSRLMALAEADTANHAKMSRALFWQGRLSLRQGRVEEGIKDLNRALVFNDSARYPYDRRRIILGLERYNPRPGFDYYNMVADDIKFFESVGDVRLLGGRYMDMGGFLNEVGAPQRGLEMLQRADSCFAIAGQKRMMSDNRINRAISYFEMHRDKEGEALLREMLADTAVINGDWRIVMILYHNLYEHTKDIRDIKSAYDIVKDKPMQDGFKCQYESIIAERFVNDGKIDSAKYYSDMAVGKLGAVYAPAVRLGAYQSRANVMDAIGNIDSAYYYLSRGVALNDSIEEEQKSAEVLNSETLKQILEQEHRADIEQRKHTTVFICIIFGVLVVAGIVAAVVYRRMQRQKLARVQTQLQLEQSQRQVLAMQLAMEEKDTLFNELSRDLNDLAEEGDISHKASIKLENSIKTHLGLEAERKGFVQTFTEVSPAFSRRLKERYPALSDADVRLASFIAVGLDNKHIARILSIRPDSVKQARWRLRTKFNLAGDESLDDIIAGFMDDCQ